MIEPEGQFGRMRVRRGRNYSLSWFVRLLSVVFYFRISLCEPFNETALSPDHRDREGNLLNSEEPDFFEINDARFDCKTWIDDYVSFKATVNNRVLRSSLLTLDDRSFPNFEWQVESIRLLADWAACMQILIFIERFPGLLGNTERSCIFEYLIL